MLTTSGRRASSAITSAVAVTETALTIHSGVMSVTSPCRDRSRSRPRNEAWSRSARAWSVRTRYRRRSRATTGDRWGQVGAVAEGDDDGPHLAGRRGARGSRARGPRPAGTAASGAAASDPAARVAAGGAGSRAGSQAGSQRAPHPSRAGTGATRTSSGTSAAFLGPFLGRAWAFLDGRRRPAPADGARGAAPGRRSPPTSVRQPAGRRAGAHEPAVDRLDGRLDPPRRRDRRVPQTGAVHHHLAGPGAGAGLRSRPRSARPRPGRAAPTSSCRRDRRGAPRRLDGRRLGLARSTAHESSSRVALRSGGHGLEREEQAVERCRQSGAAGRVATADLASRRHEREHRSRRRRTGPRPRAGWPSVVTPRASTAGPATRPGGPERVDQRCGAGQRQGDATSTTFAAHRDAVDGGAEVRGVGDVATGLVEPGREQHAGRDRGHRAVRAPAPRACGRGPRRPTGAATGHEAAASTARPPVQTRPRPARAPTTRAPSSASRRGARPACPPSDWSSTATPRAPSARWRVGSAQVAGPRQCTSASTATTSAASRPSQ